MPGKKTVPEQNVSCFRERTVASAKVMHEKSKVLLIVTYAESKERLLRG